MANLGPSGLSGTINVGDHYTLLRTKYISSGPDGFREGDFLSFSHYKSLGANEHGAWPSGTQGLDWQDLCRGPLNIATYYICKLWTSWFQRRRFFKFFPLLIHGS